MKRLVGLKHKARGIIVQNKLQINQGVDTAILRRLHTEFGCTQKTRVNHKRATEGFYFYIRVDQVRIKTSYLVQCLTHDRHTKLIC